MKKLIYTLLILGFYSIPSMGQSRNVKVNPNEQFDLYLLMGQSNMAGRSIVEAQDTVTDPNVFMLNKSGEWVPAKSPIHFDKPAAGTGLGLTFGKIMAAESRHKIGLVPCAVGGTNISRWMPGAYDNSTNTHPYDDAIKRIKIAMQQGKVKGILWHQGEGDGSLKRSIYYEQRFDSLMMNLQKDLGIDVQTTPVVVGELGRFFVMKRADAGRLNEILHTIAAKHRNMAIVSSEGLTHIGDSTHFDAASQRELGKRYAEKMIILNDKLH